MNDNIKVFNLGWPIVRATRSPSRQPMICIVSPGAAGEGFYEPACNVEVHGKEALETLREAIDFVLSEQK